MELHATLAVALAPAVTAAVAGTALTCTVPATAARHAVQLEADGALLTTVSAVCKRVAAGSALVRHTSQPSPPSPPCFPCVPTAAAAVFHASVALRRGRRRAAQDAPAVAIAPWRLRHPPLHCYRPVVPSQPAAFPRWGDGGPFRAAACAPPHQPPTPPTPRLTTGDRPASQVPSEAFARCVMEQWMDQAERVLTPLVMRALMGDAAAVAALQHVLQHLDTALVKSTKLAGGSLSLADVRGPSRPLCQLPPVPLSHARRTPPPSVPTLRHPRSEGASHGRVLVACSLVDRALGRPWRAIPKSSHPPTPHPCAVPPSHPCTLEAPLRPPTPKPHNSSERCLHHLISTPEAPQAPVVPCDR